MTPTPYYEDDAVTIYHGDCREILGLIAWPQDFPECVLVTDPPYGVGLGVGKDARAGRHGLAKGPYDGFADTYEEFCRVVVPGVRAALAVTVRGAVFSGPHLQELPKANAVGGVYCPAGAGRHQWGFKTFLPIMFYGTDPLLNKGARPNVIQSTRRADENGHPCPKPVEWMRWLVDRVGLEHETVVDPFAGSGTTLRAAKDLGRKAIGIEIDERYCEIAARRMGQEVFDLAA